MGMAGFAARLRRAFRAYEDRLRRDISQTELGELVGKQLRADAISQQSVARWFAGTLPEHARMVALAEVLGVDPGWLSYGPDEDEGQGNIPTIVPAPPQPRREIEHVADASIYATEIPRRPRKGVKRRRKGDDRSAVAG